VTKLTAPKLFYPRGKVYPEEENNVLEMKSLFDKAVARINSIDAEISNKILLQLHSLYNQATKGDIDVQSPGKSSIPMKKQNLMHGPF